MYGRTKIRPRTGMYFASLCLLTQILESNARPEYQGEQQIELAKIHVHEFCQV